MLNSGIIDLAIGMAFIFGATAGLSSVITELVARFLGLRGAYLLLGLRELLDSKSTSVVLGQAEDDFKNARAVVTATGPEASPSSATGALLGSPILRSQGMTGNIVTRKLTMDSATASPAPAADATPAAGAGAGATQAASAPPATPPPTPQDGNSRAPLPKSGNPWRTWSLRRSLPSYISARSFTEAVIDLVIPNAAGQTNMGEIQLGIDRLPASMGPLRSSLQALAANAGGDVTRFRNSIEHWYDDHMARVSGWYKRHAAWITLAVGAALVILLNINAVTIGRALYSDSAVRSAVSTAASQGNPCPAPSGQSQAQQAQGQQNCLAGLEKRVSDAAQTGLPLGWGTVPACTVPNAKCSWWEQHGITTPGDGSPWQVILVLIGFLATIAALTPGAQFWFGLVVKLNSLRSSGPPPASSAS